MSAPLAKVALCIATIVLNGLWEGALIVGIVWIGLRCIPALGAATRHAISLCTLVALVAVPIMTSVAPAGDSVRESDGTPFANTQPARPPGAAFRPTRMRADATSVASPQAISLDIESTPIADSKYAIVISQSTACGVTILWLLFASARSLRLVRDCGRIATIRREATVWSKTRAFPILVSDSARVPLALGFFHRAIVLPTHLVESFAREDLEAIVVHETAHLRRNDVWTNLFARLLEAIAALSPATWFAMRQLSIEREIACDDSVVVRTGSGVAFARTLAALAHVSRAPVPISAPSAIGSRHAIVERIERLLDTRPRRLTHSRPIVAGALALLAIIALFVQAVAPALAYEGRSADLARLDAVGSPPSVSAGSCAVPNRGIRLTYLPGMNRFDKHTRPMDLDLSSGDTFRSAPGRPLNTTFEVTVDATGKLIRAGVVSAPNVPGVKAHLERLLSASTYAPALRDCVPFATTARTSTHIMPPEAMTNTVITPLYPVGWGARTGSTCKVPTVTHGRFRPGFDPPTSYTAMLPAFPDSERSIGVDTSYTTTIRVFASGSKAMSAVVVAPSGRAAFDESALLAARNATYPLIATTCDPLPTAYLWRTTFAYQVFP